MADQDWTITTKEADTSALQQDGSVLRLTTIRYWIGKHGPFELTVPRGTPDATVNQAITNKRAELQRRSSL